MRIKYAVLLIFRAKYLSKFIILRIISVSTERLLSLHAQRLDFSELNSNKSLLLPSERRQTRVIRMETEPVSRKRWERDGNRAATLLAHYFPAPLGGVPPRARTSSTGAERRRQEERAPARRWTRLSGTHRCGGRTDGKPGDGGGEPLFMD